jgi:hypothetical protein
MALSALCKADLSSLGRTWVFRGWLIALAISELLTLSGALASGRSGAIPASLVLSMSLQGFLFVWSTFVIFLSAGSVSAESDMVTDGILSRACTRTQYIGAKLLSRMGTVLAVYALFGGTSALVCWRYAANDMTPATILTGLGVVALALILLVALGVAFSVASNNTVFAVIGVFLLWYVASPIFAFLGADYLAPASLARNLPLMLKDLNAPQVVQVTADTRSLTVYFSKKMDPAVVEAPECYAIEAPDGQLASVTAVTYDTAANSAILGGLTLKEGANLTLTLRGLRDKGGSPLSAASEVSRVVVQGSEPAQKIAGAKPRRKGPAPAILSCSLTDTSIRLEVNTELDPDEADVTANYLVESPPGKTLNVRQVIYRPKTRQVLLAGLALDRESPVRVTITNVRSATGVEMRPKGSTLTQAQVAVWKYVLGFGCPSALAALLAMVWFRKRDL